MGKKQSGPKTTRPSSAFGAYKSHNPATGKTGYGSSGKNADKARQQKEKKGRR